MVGGPRTHSQVSGPPPSFPITQRHVIVIIKNLGDVVNLSDLPFVMYFPGHKRQEAKVGFTVLLLVIGQIQQNRGRRHSANFNIQNKSNQDIYSRLFFSSYRGHSSNWHIRATE